MKTNSELKNRAIDALTGNWGLGAVCLLYTSDAADEL